MNYLVSLQKEIRDRRSNHLSANIIGFVEDTPKSIIPGWFTYESNLNEGTSYEYKDKASMEKGWILYDNICNLGKELIDKDYAENDTMAREIVAKHLKHMPAYEELKDYSGLDYINLDDFIKLYVDFLDVNLDEDVIWPYQWPINLEH